MGMLPLIIQIISYFILLSQPGEVTGETTDCIILKNIVNCPCEGTEGAPIINCRRKRLTEIPVISNASLYNGTIAEFTLFDNLIQYIPDDAFNGLLIKKLDITKNINLNNVSIHAFTGLEECLEVLKISGDKNTPPPFTAIANLTNLLELTMENYKVQNNDLTESAFLKFTKLKTLLLDSWGIVSIESHVFDGLGEVTKLVLSNQQLVGLPHEALQSLPKLEKLEITHNRLSKITSYSFTQFRKLVEINLSYNLIKVIESNSFEGITSTLEYLDLSFNEISFSNLTILQHLTGLQNLQLQNIGMLQIPTNPTFLLDKDKLQYLNLASNHLTSIVERVFVNTPKLISLDLSGNKIQTFHEKAFVSLSQLTYLRLDHQIQPVSTTIILPSFANLTSIESINLQASKLDPETSWDRLSEATSLQSLNLDNTGLEVIKNFTFKHLKNLTSLDLTDNTISHVKQESFFGLKDSLSTLVLSKNVIQTLDRCTFDNFSTHLEIHLMSNPLHCDCKLRWLRSAQLEKTITLSGYERCSSPFVKFFNTVALDDFTCNYTYTEPECQNYYTTTPVSTTTTAATTTLPRLKVEASITGTTETTITVSWSIPASGLVYIVGVYVEHEELSDATNRGVSDKLKPQVPQYEIRGLKAGTRYEITVKALRVDNLTDSVSIQSPTKSKPVSTTVTPTKEETSAELGIIIGAIIGGVVFLAILVAIIYLMFVRRKPPKDNYVVQPRTFAPTELPSFGYDSKRFIRKKKDGDKKDEIKVTVISDGKTNNGIHVGRISAGSYQSLDPETGKPVNHEPKDNIHKMKQHSYVNENPPRSTNEYADDIDIRKLPKVPADYRGNATNSGGYYNPSFRNSTQDDTPHSYSEINL